MLERKPTAARKKVSPAAVVSLVFDFIWKRGKESKLHTSCLQIAGTGGQCLMPPPEYNGVDSPVVLCSLGAMLKGGAA